jgi:ATP synthase protein I
VGENGNAYDAPQLHGEGQAHQRHESEIPAPRDENLRARLEKLTDALAAQNRDERQRAEKGQGQEGTDSSSGALGNVLSLAIRVTSEFVVAVLVGTAIGWGIDHIAGTSPAFLTVFLLLGAVAGFWNVYRIGTETPGAERK